MRVRRMWPTLIVPLAAACTACSQERVLANDSTAGVAAAAGAGAQTPAAVPSPADFTRPPDDAQRLPSGLAYRVVAPGRGTEHPRSEDRVKVYSVGWTRSGTSFDSTLAPGEPLLLRVGDGIAAWQEVLPLMVAGEKRRLWVPSRLAYGDNAPVASGDVMFDIELLSIVRPPPVPEDLRAPPPSAKITATGLRYRLLEAGAGAVRATAWTRVKVDYSGWTQAGTLFDSSVARGEPALLRRDEVVQGLAEGVALMGVGDRMRFWVPAQLGYGKGPTTHSAAPHGPLVFDVELLALRCTATERCVDPR
jgi:FKBP-type peptidyl-prolyl cis-trans isomerase